MKHGKKKSLCVSSTVSYWSQIFGLPDLKQGARVAEHKSAPVPRQQREEKKKRKEKKADLLSTPPKNQLKKRAPLRPNYQISWLSATPAVNHRRGCQRGE